MKQPILGEEHFVRVTANMIVAESTVLTIDPKFRLCYLSDEKPLAFFNNYTQVAALLRHSPFLIWAFPGIFRDFIFFLFLGTMSDYN